MGLEKINPLALGAFLWARRDKALFALFLFTAPLQIRFFFKPLSSVYVSEWTQAWVWVSDAVLLLVLVCWVGRAGRGALRALWPVLFAAPVFGLAALSPNPILGFWTAVKIAEGAALFAFVRANKNIVFSKPAVAALLTIVGIFAVFSIAQFALQQDLGLQKLGESELGVSLPAVAKFALADGTRVIRAYGLGPHPNIAALLFMASVFFLAWAYVKRGVGFVWRYSLMRQKEELLLGLPLFFVLCALAVTFSRSAWLGLIMGLAVWCFGIFAIQKLRRAYGWEAVRFLALFLAIVALLLIAVPGMGARTEVDPGEQAVTLRQFYNDVAVQLVREQPLFGFGPGQFVEELYVRYSLFAPWLLQPVHSVPYLLAAEYGLPATLVFGCAFLLLLGRAAGRVLSDADPQKALRRLAVLSSVVALAPFFLFDHFLVTLQQGRMMLWLMLGLL